MACGSPSSGVWSACVCPSRRLLKSWAMWVARVVARARMLPSRRSTSPDRKLQAAVDIVEPHDGFQNVFDGAECHRRPL